MSKPTASTVRNVNPILVCNLASLLEEVPLHSPRMVQPSLFDQPEYGNVDVPGELRLHCDHEHCEGIRRHIKIRDKKFEFEEEETFFYYIAYKCTNCTKSHYKFAIKAIRNGEQTVGVCTKIYQEPTFGQPIPKRLFHVIGEENREYFLQARRAIARGLGIGAYSYYRRIVENTKFDLIGSVLEVAQATNASATQIELLKHAQVEKQFSKAIDTLRDVSAIPPVLLIDGHNPLSLVHDLLSEGIHELTDTECLERAKEAEIILSEIANRMQIAITERKAVKSTLASILKRKSSDEVANKSA